MLLLSAESIEVGHDRVTGMEIEIYLPRNFDLKSGERKIGLS